MNVRSARISCSLCPLSFPLGEAGDHIDEVHLGGGGDRWDCGECGFTGATLNHIAAHCLLTTHDARRVTRDPLRLQNAQLDFLARLQTSFDLNDTLLTSSGKETKQDEFSAKQTKEEEHSFLADDCEENDVTEYKPEPLFLSKLRNSKQPVPKTLPEQGRKRKTMSQLLLPEGSSEDGLSVLEEISDEEPRSQSPILSEAAEDEPSPTEADDGEAEYDADPPSPQPPSPPPSPFSPIPLSRKQKTKLGPTKTKKGKMADESSIEVSSEPEPQSPISEPIHSEVPSKPDSPEPGLGFKDNSDTVKPFSAHARNPRLDPRTLQCQECSQAVFAIQLGKEVNVGNVNSSRLRNHVTRHHLDGVMLYKCSLCPFKDTVKENMVRHCKKRDLHTREPAIQRINVEMRPVVVDRMIRCFPIMAEKFIMKGDKTNAYINSF